MASFKWDKTGLLQQVFYSELQVSSFFPVKMRKSLHRVHSSCFKSKGLCNEDGYNCSGKCR